jgi:hypothetical protein
VHDAASVGAPAVTSHVYQYFMVICESVIGIVPVLVSWISK